MVFVKEDIPENFLCIEKASGKVISVEPNFCGKWCVLCCAYNPKRILTKSWHLISGNHEDLLILRDYKIGVNQTCLKCFYDSYSIKNVNNEPTFSIIWKNLYQFSVSIWY